MQARCSCGKVCENERHLKGHIALATKPDRHYQICGCGHKIERCAPENCSHRFARDALWGNS